MKGQASIIDLRRRGFTPDIVRISLDPVPEFLGNVVFETADVPERQDWRFVVGLTVMVSGQDQGLLGRIAALLGPLAKRVITNLYRWPVRDSSGLPSVQLLEITDTEGLLTWQA